MLNILILNLFFTTSDFARISISSDSGKMNFRGKFDFFAEFIFSKFNVLRVQNFCYLIYLKGRNFRGN